MVKKSKLLLALDAHKGRDYQKEHQKKLVKAAEKKKAGKKNTTADENAEETQTNGTTSQHTNGEEEWSDEQDEQEAGGVELEEVEEGSDDEDAEEEDKEEGEDDEDIPLSDLSGDERADVIPHQRLTINNSAAINSSIKRIAFITPNTPFSEHNSLVSTEPVEVPDPNDDLTRELAFYKVCQTAAVEARRQLKKEGVRFTRPGDYFAEMVKTDEHMTRIKQKLFDEAASKKAAADARRQRDLKKFGKQVQVAKLQQRQKEKRETLEKISSLKRKRKADQSGPTEDDSLFDVAIEEASKSDKRQRSSAGAGGASAKRQKKNEKYGFGGKKRFAKSGDATSSGDMRDFSVKKMKAGGARSKKGGGGAAKRPGKSRRNAMK